MSKTDSDINNVENKFKKQQLLNSKSFSGVDKDMLSIILDDEREYTINECVSILKKEKGRKVSK